VKKLLERLLPSLGKKIAAGVTLVLLVAGGAFVFFAHRTGYTMLEEQAKLQANSISSLVKDIVDQEMLKGQSKKLERALSDAVVGPYIQNTYIVSEDGRILISGKQDSGTGKFTLPDFREIAGMPGVKYMAVTEKGLRYEIIMTPIVKRQECNRCHQTSGATMGYFAVKLPTNDIRSIAAEHRTVNSLMTVLIFGGLGIIIFISLSFLVIKPISRLHAHIHMIKQRMGQLESGEKTSFPLLAEPRSKDEIADLCRDFNNLISRLNEANDKLYEMHQAQLEHADRLASTGEMAAGLAHEIKNPIAGVIGALQVFEGEVGDQDPRKEILSEMILQLERVNHAVNDLLSYARPHPPLFEEVNIADLIQKTISLLSRQSEAKHVKIRTELSTGGEKISADRKQLQQVLWNLMLNAIQAMDEPGVLSVATGCDNSSVHIRIADTGRGIPPEEIERIFKPFFTTKHKGTGLGMTISKRIIEQHAGKIEVSSLPGKGTTVTLHIPINQNSR